MRCRDILLYCYICLIKSQFIFNNENSFFNFNFNINRDGGLQPGFCKQEETP